MDAINKGYITYIYLENFVTYQKVVVKPSRYLNVIVGPNGTGKSTIVSAIVLGLGGKVNLIGRSPHIGDYVKTGETTAKIEIHLKNGVKKDHVITRTFTVDGKTTWTINGVNSNAKGVQEFTAGLNIQVDNLCQFLPQDKVQDFSKMDSKALLENTERSVGDPKLLEYHQELKEKRAQSKQLEIDIKKKRDLLKSNTEKRDGLQETVSTIKERKMIKKKMVTLRQKKAWMQYDQMRRNLVESKKIRDEAAKEMQSLDIKLKPLKKKLDKAESEVEMLKTSLSNHNNQVSAKDKKLRNIMHEIFNCETKIKEAESTCLRKIQTEQTRDQDIKLAQQQKSKLENDFSLTIKEIGSEESLTKQLKNIVSHMDEHRKKISTIMNQSRLLRSNEENVSREIRALQAQQQTLNIEAKRLDLLRQRSADAYKAVLWLRENRDKFSGVVHEPMLLSINVRDAAYAKYLETSIPMRDLIAFTCESTQDMNLLMKYLREQQNLTVNAVHSDPRKQVFTQPDVPIESIRKFGFRHYLSSLFEAPPAIMKYLISMYNLNNIPIGTKEVEDNTDRIPRNFSCYFSESNVYSVGTSKYTRETSTRISRVSSNGLLSIVSDVAKLQQLNEKIQTLQEKKNEFLNLIKEAEDKIQDETREVDRYRADRSKYQQHIQQIQALQSRIRIAADKIRQMEEDRTSVDDIRAACTKEIKAIIKQQLKIYSEYNKILEECFDCVTNAEKVKFTLALLKQSLIAKENAVEELKDKLAEAEKLFKRYDEEFQPKKRETERLYNEALKSTDNISPQDVNAFKPFNKAFEKLPATIAEINNELEVCQAKVYCMAKNVDAENVLREYENVQSNIQIYSDLVKTKTGELTKLTNEIEILKDKWLTPLERMVEQINTNFSSYFAAMDCAGEVTLAHGDDVLDFDKYGLKIRVKFRDADELQELTRHFQSGGERTVTTAIYMIALQELSRVPFRCVDEINQGMDAMNEKRVFDLLVKMTGRPGGSQYFLLTPKLLSNLSYTETVTVHCVFNGTTVDDDDEGFEEFDTEAFCKGVAIDGNNN